MTIKIIHTVDPEFIKAIKELANAIDGNSSVNEETVKKLEDSVAKLKKLHTIS